MPAPSPLQYFICCILLKIDSDSIELEMDNWRTCIMADRYSTNLSSNDKLTTLLELLSQRLHYAVYAADGSIRRLTNSKTMNVPEVSEFLPTLRSILRHFQLSGRSTALLNDALEGLDMKTVRMMSSCPTRMSYILTACKRSYEIMTGNCFCVRHNQHFKLLYLKLNSHLDTSN